MRTILGFVGLGVAALAMAAPAGSKALSDYIKALGTADTLHARYTFQAVGGAPGYYSVDLKKPNQARIDTPARTIVADGSTITTLDKVGNVYSKRPQTDLELAKLFATDDLYLWTGFFSQDSASVFQARDRGTTDIAGSKLNIVQADIDKNGRRAVTYYFSPQDNLVRQAQIDIVLPSGKTTAVVATKEISAGSALDSNAFVYNNASGATEVSWEDMQPLRWISDVKEAIRLATASNKKILIDFYGPLSADWQKLDQEVFRKQDFREYAKKLILVRIDATMTRRTSNRGNQTDPVQTYGVQQVPTEIVLDKDGTVIDSTVGYSGSDAFYTFLKTAVGN